MALKICPDSKDAKQGVQSSQGWIERKKILEEEKKRAQEESQQEANETSETID